MEDGGWVEAVCRINPILFSKDALGDDQGIEEFAKRKRMNQLSREMAAFMEAAVQTLAADMEKTGDFNRIGELEFELRITKQPIGTNPRYPVADA